MSKFISKYIIVILIWLLNFYAGLAMSAQLWQPGFRTISHWDMDNNIKLNVNIWYPTVRPPRALNYPPYTINGALNTKPAEGSFPLIIISHPSPANRFSLASLGEWLAKNGYVAAAPNHSRDCLDNMDNLFTWNQLKNRVQEISMTINLVLNNKDIKDIVDSKRIGLLGFGAGGTTALILGGALPNCNNWTDYCAKAGGRDPYCTRLTKAKFANICNNFPLQKSLANPLIKAIVIVAPGYGMLFDQSSFKYFYPPLLIISAGKDDFNIPLLHSDAIASYFGSKVHTLEFMDADITAFLDQCPDELLKELPELCNSVSPAMRRQIRNKLENDLLVFYSHYLIKNIKDIPLPPDLTPALEIKPQSDKENDRKTVKKNRRKIKK